MSVTDGKGRLVAVVREPEPFEVMVAWTAMLYGVVCSLDYSLAATAIRTYPFFGGRVFLAGMALAALTILVGVMRRSEVGMKIERAGLLLLSTLACGYLLWAPFAVGKRGIGLMLFLGLVMAVPSFIVARRLGKYIQDVERSGEVSDGVADPS